MRKEGKREKEERQGMGEGEEGIERVWEREERETSEW